jgi:hypothetical protein
LKGFTGNQTPGIRRGSIPSHPVEVNIEKEAKELEDEDNEAEGDLDKDDEDVVGNIGGLVDYISDLPSKK